MFALLLIAFAAVLLASPAPFQCCVVRHVELRNEAVHEEPRRALISTMWRVPVQVNNEFKKLSLSHVRNRKASVSKL